MNFFTIKEKTPNNSMLFAVETVLVSAGSSPVAGVRSVGVWMWVKPWKPLDCVSVRSSPAQLALLLVVVSSPAYLSDFQSVTTATEAPWTPAEEQRAQGDGEAPEVALGQGLGGRRWLLWRWHRGSWRLLCICRALTPLSCRGGTGLLVPNPYP